MYDKTIFRIAASLWISAVLLTGCAALTESSNGGIEPETGEAADVTTGTVIPYAVKFAGVDAEPGLGDLLRRASLLVELEKRPPTTNNGLIARADRDVERLLDVLHSEGFYAAKVSYRIDRDAEPRTVTVDVAPGDLYLLEEFNIEYTGAGKDAPNLPRNVEALKGTNVHIGSGARAPDLVAAERALVERLKEIGRPLARAVDRHVSVNHNLKTVLYAVTVDAGPVARFGTVSFEGLETVEEPYVRALIPWRDNDFYDVRKVDAYKKALNQTGLFQSVEIVPADTVDADGRIALAAKLPEAKHRSIGAKLGYNSDEGFNGSAFWEHRNFFGRNEQLRFSTRLGKLEQRLDAEFRKPVFLRHDQSLLANAALHREEFDAFTERGASTFLGLERKFSDIWSANAGVAPEYSIQKSSGESQTLFLLGFPLSATRDTSDDLLNPSQGTRTKFQLTPYAGTLENNVAFVRGEVSGSGYLSVDDNKRFILAGRYYYGSIYGEDTADVPSSKRFFAGGGGSIRGYKFQSVGPLEGATPVGGRSVFELGLETRIRVTDTIGLVPFVEGGQVEDDMFFNDFSNLQWAAGLGFRYFTAVGPIRLDVAFPINPREDIDSLFEFYVSVGQSF